MDIKFYNLWTNHPAIKGDIYPCTTEEIINFNDQSAIRMSVCLRELGISLDNFSGKTCLPEHRHNQSHILHPEELAIWLESSRFGTPTKTKRARSSMFKGKKGIVLLKNYRKEGCLCNHIDLWNGNLMTYGSPSYFASSKEIWFWEVK